MRVGEATNNGPHRAYTTLVYERDTKGYVPHCECGWVGYFVRRTVVTSLAGAGSAALVAAQDHVDSMPTGPVGTARYTVS